MQNIPEIASYREEEDEDTSTGRRLVAKTEKLSEVSANFYNSQYNPHNDHYSQFSN